MKRSCVWRESKTRSALIHNLQELHECGPRSRSFSIGFEVVSQIMSDALERRSVKSNKASPSQLISVQDKIPFTYEGAPGSPSVVQQEKPSKNLGKTPSSRAATAGSGTNDKKVLRISLASTGIVLVGLGVVFTGRYAHEVSVYKDMQKNPAKYAEQLKQDPDLWNTQISKKQNAGILAVFTDVAAGLCAVGF